MEGKERAEAEPEAGTRGLDKDMFRLEEKMGKKWGGREMCCEASPGAGLIEIPCRLCARAGGTQHPNRLVSRGHGSAG